MSQPQTMKPIRLEQQHRAVIEKYATIFNPEDSEPPILNDATRAALIGWLREMDAANELASVGLKARRTALFSGPPGCGKTTMAHHIAARRGCPLVLIDMSALRSQYIGQTGQQIVELFRAMRPMADKIVILLDEFDAIATKRKAVEQTSDREAASIVIGLLQYMDSWPGLMIAATNMATNIDPALWRRFGVSVEIGLPDDEPRFAIIRRYLAPFKMPDDDIWALVNLTGGATPALLRQLCEGIKRELVLAPRMAQSLDFPDVLARVLASCRPHDDMAKPALWDTPGEMRSPETWPPEREG